MSQKKPYAEVGRECRFAIHIPTNHPDIPDIHYVKEQVTVKYEDGTTEQIPKLRRVDGYKRPYWIVPKSKRHYEQKKEYEKLDNLHRVEVTQSDLRNSIARALDKHWSKDPIKVLLKSPYIYGADMSSTSLIKKEYMMKYPDLITPYTRCILDVESDVIHGHEEVIMTTVIFKKEIFISVEKRFLQGYTDIQERLDRAVDRYIKEYVDKHEMKVTLHIADGVVDMLKNIFSKVHAWKPDWLAIWNIKFDIPKIIDMLEKYNVDPKDVLCDPSIPPELRICKFMPGPDKQTTASGKVKPINPAAQWHTLRCTASYYAIDAMCVYKHLRLGEQEESSYSLDSILNKILGIRKLNFKEAEGLEKLKWHQFMQKNYPFEYMVYNIFDCLSMIELDDKLKDLAYTLPAFAQTTDFANFKSQPRKIVDEFYYYALEEGHVVGTVGQTEKVEAVSSIAEEEDFEDKDEEDEEENTTAVFDGLEEDDEQEREKIIQQRSTLSLKNWIVTLPAHMSVLGLPLIEEDPSLHTNVRTHVYDSDEVAAYPTATTVCNVSRATTKREIIDVVGVKESVFRMQNMNLLLGPVNALEYGTTMFNLPKPEELLLLFQQQELGSQKKEDVNYGI